MVTVDITIHVALAPIFALTLATPARADAFVIADPGDRELPDHIHRPQRERSSTGRPDHEPRCGDPARSIPEGLPRRGSARREVRDQGERSTATPAVDPAFAHPTGSDGHIACRNARRVAGNEGPSLPKWCASAALLLAASLILGACASSVSGMGYMRSAADPSALATFGFVFDASSDDPDRWRFRGDYADQAAGVQLRGVGVLLPLTTPPPFPNAPPFNFCMEADLEYTVPGMMADPLDPPWQLHLIACDTGEPGSGPAASAGDWIFIQVLTGPFATYVNQGPVLGGNLQS
jgi:hypothetical protein